MIPLHPPVSESARLDKNVSKQDPVDRLFELIARLLAVSWLRSQAQTPDEPERPLEQPAAQ